MSKKALTLDETDRAILKRLQEDSREPLERIAKELQIPKSTVHYKVKRMEQEQVIEGYHAKVNAAKLGKDYITVTFVRAKYGPSYHDKTGKMLSQIPGAFSVYFVFGEYDFVVLIKSNDREDFLKKLEKMINMKEVERTNTQIVANVLKEENKIDI